MGKSTPSMVRSVTTQELEIKSLLEALQMPFETQVPIRVDKSVIIVDFCIANRYLVECCYSAQTSANAMGMLRRSAAYIDWKARQIHRRYGSTYLVGAILEAPRVQRRFLERSLHSIVEDVDFLFFDANALGEYLVGLREAIPPRRAESTSCELDRWVHSVSSD